ncbi:P-loop NTPase family protein [Nostoc sp.]
MTNAHQFMLGLRSGKFDPQIRISVDVLKKGFDEPTVGCIVQARPTMSRIKNRQQIGRGSRKHPGKEYCIVLDYAGMLTALDLLPQGKRWV